MPAPRFRGRGGPLTVKQHAFVLALLGGADSAREAALQAGYSSKTAGPQGAQLMRSAKVRRAVERLMKEREHRSEITIDRVINYLGDIVFRPIPPDEPVPWDYRAKCLELLLKHLVVEGGGATDRLEMVGRLSHREVITQLIDVVERRPEALERERAKLIEGSVTEVAPRKNGA